jgi:D-sedoheptulose 7-phosphate isomerase
MTNWIEQALADAASLIEWLRRQEEADGVLTTISRRLADTLASGGRVLTCGNGGSMCDAMHFAEELSGRYRQDRAAFAAQAMSDPAHMSCVANDFGFERVFARGVEAWGKPGDLLVVFSTSGSSPNIVAAARSARERRMTVVGLLGRDGGEVRALCDLSLVVPAQTSDRIQEVHEKTLHLLIEGVERLLVPEHYQAQSALPDEE